MTCRIFFIASILLFFPVILCRAEAADDPGLINIHGNSQAVDIKDILHRSDGILTENDIKRICAEITGRYHERGYTAFYVRRAVLNKNGTADLYFNEPVVSAVTVTGITIKSDDVAASIYSRGELFNEITLKAKVSDTKKKFNIRQLKITVRRDDDGDIILTALAVQKNFKISTGIYNTPIYGVLPRLEYSLNLAGFSAGVTAVSSFNREERSYSGGSVYINSDNIQGNSFFFLCADAAESRDSFNENHELIYRHKSISPGCGYNYINGAAVIRVLFTGTVDDLKDYPGPDGGVSFSGARLNLNYDNSLYKIDFAEVTSGEIEISGGWNSVEDRPSVKLKLNYMINLPLVYRFFLSFNGNSLYTSDRERFLQFYAYDRMFPCRQDDYSTASWRNITGLDIVYEVFEDTFFISPGIKWGLHNSDSRINSIYAFESRCFFKSDSVKAEISWMYDIKYNFRKGFLMFSVSAAY